MSKLRQALNYLEILREAIKLPLKNTKLTLSIIFFILLPLNLLVLAADLLSLPPSFEFIGDVLQWLAMTVVISVVSKAYVHKPLSASEFLSALSGSQWRKILVTSILTESTTFMYSTLVLVLGYPQLVTDSMPVAVRFVVMMTEFCLFVVVRSGCQLSLVISSVEDGSYGLKAPRRAVEITKGRRLQSFVLMTLMFVFDAFVNAPIGILQLLWCSVYCMIYIVLAIAEIHHSST